MTMSESLADFIKRAVALRNLSLRQASKDMGFGASYLERIVNGGIKRPSPERVKIIAKFFNADPDHLMELAGYLSPQPSSDPLLDEIMRLARLLSDQDKRAILQYARALKVQADVQALAANPSSPSSSETTSSA